MRLINLERYLRDHGCHCDRHGGNHDVWLNPRAKRESAVPRHREIKLGDCEGDLQAASGSSAHGPLSHGTGGALSGWTIPAVCAGARIG
jgi:hypothetical protein